MRSRWGVTGLGFAAAAVALSAVRPAGGVDWVELGPAPISNGSYTGRIAAIACSPTDAGRYFVGAADGGVWRTTDGGTTWTPLTDGLPTTAIGALALDPTNENIVYAGSGEANFANHSRYGLGLYKSMDGGQTWEVLGAETFAGRCFSRIVVHPGSPNTIYAAITRAGGFPEMAAAKGHPNAAGPLGVFHSDAGGTSWTQLAGGLPAEAVTDLSLEPGNPAVLYAAVGRIFGSAANGIYKSVDGGASWTKLGGGLPTNSVGRISLAVSPTMPQRVYAMFTFAADAFGGGASTQGAFRSDDGGAAWTSLPLGGIQSSYGWYLSTVSVHPTNADIVLMGGLILRRSQNAGATWATVTPPHVDLHAIAWDAAGRLVVGDDGGVHRSANLGASWSSLNDGLGAVQFYAGLSTDPGAEHTLLGGTQDNGSNRRTTDTRAWTQVFGGDGGWTQIDASSPNRMFVEFQGTGNLYRSTNGGTSFYSSSAGINGLDRNCFLPPYLIDPNDPARMLYATHRLYRSVDGGSSWSVLSGDLTGGSGAIRSLAWAASDSSVVYAATNNGRVLASFDGGATFELIDSGVPGWPRVTRELFVDPGDPLTLYQAVSGFGTSQVRRTRDGGQTWEPLDAGLPDVPVNTIAVDVRGPRPVIFAGADGGLYRSIDEGATWHRYGAGLPNAAVIDLLLEPQRSRLIAATQGRGAWSIAIALPGDLDGDGAVAPPDVEAFVLALIDPGEFADAYPDVDRLLAGDLNGNGRVDGDDIGPFVEWLAAGG